MQTRSHEDLLVWMLYGMGVLFTLVLFLFLEFMVREPPEAKPIPTVPPTQLVASPTVLLLVSPSAEPISPTPTSPTPAVTSPIVYGFPPTLTPTSAPTPTPTPTSVPTPTPTPTPSPTPIPPPTPTLTPTPTPKPKHTPTPTPASSSSPAPSSTSSPAL